VEFRVLGPTCGPGGSELIRDASNGASVDATAAVERWLTGALVDQSDDERVGLGRAHRAFRRHASPPSPGTSALYCCRPRCQRWTAPASMDSDWLGGLSLFHLLVVDRRQVVERRVESERVVEGLDVVEDGGASFAAVEQGAATK
jgi:hypothetical protein